MIEEVSRSGKRHIKRDYYSKSFSNPYFSGKEAAGNKFNTKRYLSIAAVLFLVYVIVFSDLFKVQKIDVQGTDMINPAEIQNVALNMIQGNKLLILPGRNLLFVCSSKISDELKNKFALSDISVTKGWQAIKIKVEEKTAYIIIFNGKGYYFADVDGTITKQLSAEEQLKYANKFAELHVPQDLNINDKPVSGRIVNYTIELNKALQAANIRVKYFESREVDSVAAITEAGWEARFSANTPLSIAMANLTLAMNKKLSAKKLQYIDVRLADRVSYFPEK